MKIPNKKKLQKMTSNHFSNIDFKDFMKLYKDYAKKQFSFSVNNNLTIQLNHQIIH